MADAPLGFWPTQVFGEWKVVAPNSQGSESGKYFTPSLLIALWLFLDPWHFLVVLAPSPLREANDGPLLGGTSGILCPSGSVRHMDLLSHLEGSIGAPSGHSEG